MPRDDGGPGKERCACAHQGQGRDGAHVRTNREGTARMCAPRKWPKSMCTSSPVLAIITLSLCRSAIPSTYLKTKCAVLNTDSVCFSRLA